MVPEKLRYLGIVWEIASKNPLIEHDQFAFQSTALKFALAAIDFEATKLG